MDRRTFLKAAGASGVGTSVAEGQVHDAGEGTKSSPSAQWDNGIFGGAWIASTRLASADDDINYHAKATLAVVRFSNGSAINGPAASNYAGWFSSCKSSYQTSDVDGEVDGLFIVAAQGKNGDVGGALIDVTKVGEGTGGAVGVESSLKVLGLNQATLRAVQGIKNFQEGLGGVSGGTGFGDFNEALYGTSFSAFHADQREGVNGAKWDNLLTYYAKRSNQIFRIDGEGRIYASGGWYHRPSYSFQNSPNTGLSSPTKDTLAISTGGVVRAKISERGDLLPGQADTYSIGSPSCRYNSIFLLLGPMVSADRALMSDLTVSKLGLEFIKALIPRSYQLNSESAEIKIVTEDEEAEEQVTVRKFVEVDRPIFNGKDLVSRKNHEWVNVPVFDTVQARDEVSGELIFADADVVVRTQYPSSTENIERVPVMVQVPRMRKVIRSRSKPIRISSVGVKHHYGFLHDEIAGALESINSTKANEERISFGGLSQAGGADGCQRGMLRPDELLAPIVSAIQDLARRLERVEELLERST